MKRPLGDGRVTDYLFESGQIPYLNIVDRDSGPRSLTMFWTLPRFTTLPIISQPFKRAQEGLFHGKMRRSGNNVPHSKHKTKRTWLPNVRSKKLPLEATGETLKLKVTVRALRSIRKVRV